MGLHLARLGAQARGARGLKGCGMIAAGQPKKAADGCSLAWSCYGCRVLQNTN
jgi:hypothetical protein